MEFIYPAEFVKKVKAEYPGHIRLHDGLDENNEDLGHFLDDPDPYGFRFELIDVVAAFDEGHAHTIYETAKKALRREELYYEWIEICHRHKAKS